MDGGMTLLGGGISVNSAAELSAASSHNRSFLIDLVELPYSEQIPASESTQPWLRSRDE